MGGVLKLPSSASDISRYSPSPSAQSRNVAIFNVRPPKQNLDDPEKEATSSPRFFPFISMAEEDKAALRKKLKVLFEVKESETDEAVENLVLRCSDAAVLAKEFSLDYFKDLMDDISQREYLEREAEEAWADEAEEPEGQYVLKLKLVINETSYFHNLPSIINRAVQSRVKMNYGLMHTGLLLGDKIVDWNNNSVVFPRAVATLCPRLTVDLCNIDLEKEEDMTKLWKMCNKIVEWNAREYHSTKANCQVFVDDVLQAMGISIPSGGALGKALNELKSDGRLSMTYTPPDGYQPSKTVTFAKHEDLDIYVNSLMAAIPDFQHKHKYDWALLKAFDRAFWLMFYNRSEPDKERREAGIACGMPGEDCPFGNPKETGTLLG